MTIKKSGKVYTVRENKKSWTLSTKNGNVSLVYNVQKADCPTFDDLKGYVVESDLF